MTKETSASAMGTFSLLCGAWIAQRRQTKITPRPRLKIIRYQYCFPPLEFAESVVTRTKPVVRRAHPILYEVRNLCDLDTIRSATRALNGGIAVPESISTPASSNHCLLLIRNCVVHQQAITLHEINGNRQHQRHQGAGKRQDSGTNGYLACMSYQFNI